MLEERLKPCLLDRLTDDEPSAQREAPRARYASARTLRESVVRDLGWLLNSVRLSSVIDLSAYPYVEKSVLNFGLPDLAGRTLSSIDVSTLETELKHAILLFEPRFLPESVKVEMDGHASEAAVNSIQFTIEALLQAYPAPLSLWLRTEIDLETGGVVVY